MENRRELLQDELPSGVFQWLVFGTTVSYKGFSKVHPDETAENITYYPQIMFRVEEALSCSFRAKNYHIMQARLTYYDVHS